MPTVDPARVKALKDVEDERFVAARPRTIELWQRAERSMPNGVPMAWMRGSYHHPPLFVDDAAGMHFRDVDGHDYVDFNVADLSMFCGYAPEPIVRAVSERMTTGNQFLLPTEDAIAVSEELTRRWRLPKWQYTSSATQANTEAIRVARVVTGRDKVLMFDGKYHGHFDEALVQSEDGELVAEEGGLAADATSNTVLVPWNDLDSLEAALSREDIALVMMEPSISNNVVLLLPDEGFHEAIRSLTRDHGTLLAYDETHTLISGPGGLVGRWGLDPDVVVAGKSIAGGLPMGAYGMREEIADVIEQHKGPDGERAQLVATGGTIFGNPLSMAAARAALTQVLTDEAYEHTAALGERLADGLRAAVDAAGLDWYIYRLYARSGYTFAPTAPRDAAAADAVEDELLRRLIRIWLANRGVWEAIVGAGPVAGVPASVQDVDRYVEAFGELTQELVKP